MAEIDADLVKSLTDNGYLVLRLMPDGHIAGITKFLFTYGLCARLDFSGLGACWCFEVMDDAFRALIEWDGAGDPPGPWIKQKAPAERCNPLLFDVIGRNSSGGEITRRKAEIDEAALWPARP